MRRETGAGFLRGAEILVRPPGWGRRTGSKPAAEVITEFGVGIGISFNSASGELLSATNFGPDLPPADLAASLHGVLPDLTTRHCIKVL